MQKSDSPYCFTSEWWVSIEKSTRNKPTFSASQTHFFSATRKTVKILQAKRWLPSSLYFHNPKSLNENGVLCHPWVGWRNHCQHKTNVTFYFLILFYLLTQSISFLDAFNKYKSAQQVEGNSVSIDSSWRKNRNFFDTYCNSEAVVSNEGKETEIYLNEPCVRIVNNMDTLNYWKTHAVRFPVLAKMAKDHSCTQCSNWITILNCGAPLFCKKKQDEARNSGTVSARLEKKDSSIAFSLIFLIN